MPLTINQIAKVSKRVRASLWDHSFSTFAKFSQRTNISYPLLRTRTCANQGLRNVSFSENFANVLNE